MCTEGALFVALCPQDRTEHPIVDSEKASQGLHDYPYMYSSALVQKMMVQLT